MDDSEFEFLDDNSVIVKDEDGNLINSDDVEVIRKSTIVTENENENVINMPETIVITKEEDESDNLIKMERERENLDDVNQFKTKLPNDTDEKAEDDNLKNLDIDNQFNMELPVDITRGC